MKWIPILLLLIGCASADTLWAEGTIWHPSGGDTYYTLGENFTNLGSINLTADSFHSKNINLTIYDNSNITIYFWNTTYVNYTNTAPHNISVCGLATGSYNVEQTSGTIWSKIPSSSSCVGYNLTDADYTNLSRSIEVLVCTSLEYALYNGSVYITEMNQTWPFYCFPEQEGCVPKYQGVSQWLSNWTNTYATTQNIYLRVNETVRGYTIYANQGSDSYVSATNITSTSPVSMGTVSAAAEVKYWHYVSTFYPYEDYNAQMIMEVCDA